MACLIRESNMWFFLMVEYIWLFDVKILEKLKFQSKKYDEEVFYTACVGSKFRIDHCFTLVS